MHVGWITDVQDALDFYNAGTHNTGHVQFTQDQTPIPGTNGTLTVNDINIPVAAEPAIVDFLTNALTDPRVASETFPFNRPTLFSEMEPEAEVHVDPAYDGLEDGTTDKPYDSVAEGLVHVESGGKLVIEGGTTVGPSTIDQPVTLMAVNGPVTLGAAPARSADPSGSSSGGFVSRSR
jgi:hypothetical protein